ncbi:MAG: hypothetical protein ACYTFK_11975 [Planctomycetota bacterium]|jgi:hypothetical protein
MATRIGIGGGREVCDGDVQYKLWLLYWIPDGCDWSHGWEYRYFNSAREVYLYCKDNLELIEIAECGDNIVRDGKLVCQDCGEFVGDYECGVYPVCAKCDVWEG